MKPLKETTDSSTRASSKNKKQRSSVITTTFDGKTVSFRLLSSTEIKSNRNSAYAFLK